MAGPDFIGVPTFLSDSIQAPGALVFLANDTLRDDVNVSFHIHNLLELLTLQKKPVPFPWSQGFNTVSSIYDIEAFSAFNGYSEIKSDKPFIISLGYDPGKLFNLSTNTLRIAHYDE